MKKQILLTIFLILLVAIPLWAVTNFSITDEQGRSLVLGTGMLSFPNISGVNNEIHVKIFEDNHTSAYSTWSSEKIDTLLDNLDHINLQNIGTNSHAQIDTHISDADKHREINDSGTGTTDLWSANKIASEISGAGSPLEVTDDTTTVTQVDKIRFNPSSGFSITDDGNNDVTINLGSSFNPIQVDGESDLEATGEEALEIEAGTGIEITTNAGATPQKLTISSTGSGSGDMLKSTYDTDADDYVDAAESINDGTYSKTAQAISEHIDSTSNPHSVDAADVGLANVTNDAQLTRSADDWSGFSQKSTPVSADVLLMEDSEASGAKKRVLWSQLPSGGGSFDGTLDGVLKLLEQGSDPEAVANYGLLYTKAVPGDPVDFDTKLLIESDTVDDSTVFFDSSNFDLTINPQGSVHHEADQSKFGATSIYFNGSTDYLTVDDDAVLQIGSSDFTFDFWIYPTTVDAGDRIIEKGNYADSSRAIDITFTSDRKINVWSSPDGGTDSERLSGTIVLSLSTWTHVAIVKASSTWYLFINGTLDEQQTHAVNVYAAAGKPLNIGAYHGGGNKITGYIDEFRFSKAARWTENFTPPAIPYSGTSNALFYKSVGGDVSNLIAFPQIISIDQSTELSWECVNNNILIVQGEYTVTLAEVSTDEFTQCSIYAGSANSVTVTPDSNDRIRLLNSVKSDGISVASSGQIGESLTIFNDSEDGWSVLHSQGTWN